MNRKAQVLTKTGNPQDLKIGAFIRAMGSTSVVARRKGKSLTAGVYWVAGIKNDDSNHKLALYVKKTKTATSGNRIFEKGIRCFRMSHAQLWNNLSLRVSKHLAFKAGFLDGMVQAYLKRLGKYEELYDSSVGWEKTLRNVVKSCVGKNPFHVAEDYVDDLVSEALDGSFTKATVDAFKPRTENAADDFRKYMGECFRKKLVTELTNWTNYQSKFCRQRMSDHTNEDFTQEEIMDMLSQLSVAGMSFDESGDLVDDEGHAAVGMEYDQLVDHIRDRLERSTGKKYIVQMLDLIIENDDGSPAFLIEKLKEVENVTISKQAVSQYKEEMYRVISDYAKETKNELLMILLVRMKRKLVTAGNGSKTAKDGGWSSLFKIYKNFRKGHIAELEQEFEETLAKFTATRKKVAKEMLQVQVDLLPNLGATDVQLYFLKEGGDIRTHDELIQNILGVNSQLEQYQDVVVGDGGVLVGIKKKVQARRRR